MGWGLRVLALFLGLAAFGAGMWPIVLLAAFYIVFSLRRRGPPRGIADGRRARSAPGRPWAWYALGGVFFLFSGAALAAGGTLSPGVFLFAGAFSILLPQGRPRLIADQVVPMKESILLRSRLLPLRWYALAEVKLESRGQSRGISAIEGRLLVFGGKNPATVHVLHAYSLGHKGAEEKIVGRLRQETRMLSQRGAHLLPLDSADAFRWLCLKLERIGVGAYGPEAAASLPFDLFALRSSGGMVVGHEAFRIGGAARHASVPRASISLEREPLLVEVVEGIGERHGWPDPDGFSPFLAAMDASRDEPLADRIRTKGEAGGRVAVEAPGGAEVMLTRAQLRAVARIYG